MSIAARNIERDLPRLTPSFEALYADHYDFLWRCALRLGADPKDVEDIVQEVFMIALRRYDETEFTSARPSTWLFAILHNVMRNHSRGERRRRARLEAVAEIEQGRSVSDLQVQSSLGLRLLDEFLADLDPDRRVVFVLADLEGMRGPEIARALGLNHNTVRSRLRGARQAFAACFQHEGDQVVVEATHVAAPAEVRARGLVLLAVPMKPWTTVGGLWGWLSSVRGLATVVSLAVAGAVVFVSARTQPRESPERDQAEIVASEPTRTPTSKADETLHEDEPAAIVIEADRTPAKPAREDSLAWDEALALLERARAAMRSGDAATALSLLDGQERWPAALDAHRVALEIGALCRIGQPQRARERSLAWQQAHSGESTAVSVVPPCWNDDNTSMEAGHPSVKSPTSANEE